MQTWKLSNDSFEWINKAADKFMFVTLTFMRSYANYKIFVQPVDAALYDILIYAFA